MSVHGTISAVSGRPLVTPTAGNAVKARIIAAGLTCTALAAEAGIKKNTLSHYIGGVSADPETQMDIWIAFRRLTGSAIGMDEFWGPLYRRRRAS